SSTHWRTSPTSRTTIRTSRSATTTVACASPRTPSAGCPITISSAPPRSTASPPNKSLVDARAREPWQGPRRSQCLACERALERAAAIDRPQPAIEQPGGRPPGDAKAAVQCAHRRIHEQIVRAALLLVAAQHPQGAGVLALRA